MKDVQESIMEPARAGTHKITVTVDYTGHDPFVDGFNEQEPLLAIKRKAMMAFGLEESAAGDYALQFAGVNQDDHVKVGDLATEHLLLTLVRVKPQEKGRGGRAR